MGWVENLSTSVGTTNAEELGCGKHSKYTFREEAQPVKQSGGRMFQISQADRLQLGI